MRLAREKKNKEQEANNILNIKDEIKEEIKINLEKKDKITSLDYKGGSSNSDEEFGNINNSINRRNSIEIKHLKENIKPKENLKNYFQRMNAYYKIDKFKMYYYLYDLANNDYYSLDNKFKFKINYEKSPFVSNMFKFLKEQLKSVKDTNNKDVYKEYQGEDSFGFLIYKKNEYFYVFKNEFNRNLFNDINRVKQYEINNASDVQTSRHSYKTENENFDKIDSRFLTSEDFENKINKFFKKFNLIELPNYFFRLNKKNQFINNTKKDDNFNDNKIDMNYADENYFSAFIEIDGAFAYNDNNELDIIKEDNKMFKVSKTISVSSWGKDIKIEQEDKNNLKIKGNTILLIEDKLSFPKVIYDLKKKQKMNKEELYLSLNFLIYKTIKKINIFNEYLNSISKEKKNYSYCLLLIYDTSPIANVENVIKTILCDLYNEKLIKYSSFYIKVIYVLPCISFNDSKRVEKLEKKIKEMEDEMREIKMQLNQMNVSRETKKI